MTATQAYRPTEAGQIMSVPMDRIIAGDNDRKNFNQDELAELAASIKMTGLIQPITVRRIGQSHTFEIIAGERRFRAHQLLEASHIDAVIKKGLSEDEVASAMLAENLSRVDLDPVEEADAYRRRLDAGDTMAELASAAGVSEARIHTRLPINNLPDVLKSRVSAGDLGVNHARFMAGLDHDDMIAVCRQLFRRELSLFAFRDLCERVRNERDQGVLFAMQVEEFALEAEEGRRTVKRSELLEVIALLAEVCPDEELAARASRLLEQ